MSKKNTGRRGRQANIVGGGTATVGFGGLSGGTVTTSSATPVPMAGNATVGGNTMLQTGVVSKDTGIISGGSSGAGTPAPSTPSTPSIPTKTTTPTVTPTVTTPTPTVTAPTPAKIITSPTLNPVVTPTTPTTPVKVGVTDGPVAEQPTKPGFSGLDDSDNAGHADTLRDIAAGFPEDGMDLLRPVAGPATPTPTQETPAEEKPKSNKKKWLVMIVVGIALWLLFKKK